MVLSDNETKLFYKKFEKLEKKAREVDTMIKPGGIFLFSHWLKINKMHELIKEIHNIVYEVNDEEPTNGSNVEAEQNLQQYLADKENNVI